MEVFTLKGLKKLDKHDGDIVFSKHGSNYPTDGKFYEQRVVDINKGDMVLFPSSIYFMGLFHLNQRNKE